VHKEITAEVLDAAISGDPDALGEIYRILSPRVVGYLRARGASDPEGTTTDTFIQVFQRIESLTGGASGLRSLVFTVAHARLVDDLRARARGPILEEYEPIDDIRTTDSAEEAALRRQALQDVLNTLACLPDDQKSVITLRILGQLSLEETANVMERSVGAIKQLQRRGLITLRESLTPAQ